MKQPIHTLVAEMVSKLSEELQFEFQERAAIMKFEGAMLRDHAECLALLDVIWRHPEVLPEHRQEQKAVTEPSPNGIKKYFGKLYERNGEFEYRHPVLFESTDIDPMLELTRMAREFYPDKADEQDEGFYFFCGGICVKPESVVEVTEEEYALLVKYISLPK